MRVALDVIHEVRTKADVKQLSNYEFTCDKKKTEYEMNKYLHFQRVVNAHARNVKFPYELLHLSCIDLYMRMSGANETMNQLHAYNERNCIDRRWLPVYIHTH